MSAPCSLSKTCWQRFVLEQNSPIHIGYLADAGRINDAILKSYLLLDEKDFKRRSHSFGGRYENLYLDQARISELEQVLAQAWMFAASILGLTQNALKMGFWFNDMGPGDAKSRHDHVEFDELLSAVYYVHAPENSGNLIIHDPHSQTEVTPESGMYVFFSPSVQHSVSVNQSTQRRLSIGMNFGPA